MEGKDSDKRHHHIPRQTHYYPRPKDRKKIIHIQDDSASIGIGRNTIGNPNNNNNNKEIQMRKITEIILHCSATPEGKDFKAADIRRWHVQGNGWKDIGYNYVIDLDGTIEDGRPLYMNGAHTVGHNQNSIGICYIGGVEKDNVKKSKDTRTIAQKESMYALVYQLLSVYDLSIKDVHCHYEFNATACPSFKIEQFREEFNKWLEDYLRYKEKEKEDE